MKYVFHESIKFIQVDIRKELGSKIADRDPSRAGFYSLSLSLSLSNWHGLIAAYNSFQETYRLVVHHPLSENPEQDVVINAVKKSFDITLQNETRSRVISRSASRHAFKCSDTAMRAISNTARKRGPDERLFKNRVNDGKYGVVEYAITHGRLVDMALFRVGYVKSRVRTVLVRFIFQLAMERENVFLQPPFEVRHVGLVSFVALERVPRRKQVFRRDDSVE